MATISFKTNPYRGTGVLSAIVVDSDVLNGTRHQIDRPADTADNWRTTRNVFQFYDDMKFERNEYLSEVNPYTIQVSRYVDDDWEFIEAEDTTLDFEDCAFIYMAVTVDANNKITNCGFVYSAKMGDELLWYITPGFNSAEIITRLNRSIYSEAPDVITCGTTLGDDFVFTGLNEDVTYHGSIGRDEPIERHFPINVWTRRYGPIPPPQISTTNCTGIVGTSPDDEFPRGVEILAGAEEYDNPEAFATFVKTQIPVLGTDILEYVGLEPGTAKELVLNSGYKIQVDLDGAGERFRLSLRDAEGNYVTLKNYHGGNVQTLTTVYTNNDTNGYLDKLYLAKYPYTANIEDAQLMFIALGRCGGTTYLGNWGFGRIFGNDSNGKPDDSKHNGLLSTSFLDDLLTDEDGNSIVEEKPDPRVEPTAGPEFPGADDTADKYNDPETGTPGNNGSYQDAVNSAPTPVPTITSDDSIYTNGASTFYRPFEMPSIFLNNLGKHMGLSIKDGGTIFNILNKYFDSRPLDFILSLHQVPGKPTRTQTETVPITLCGEYVDGRGEGVATDPIQGYPLDEVYEINCGTAKIYNRWGTATDFESTAEMWLPFIGYVKLDVSRITPVNPSASYIDISLKYKISASTGVCVAILHTNLNEKPVILGQWVGNCKREIPLTQVSYDRVVSSTSTAISGLVSLGTAAGAAVATGGLSVPITAGILGGAGAMAGGAFEAAKSFNQPDVAHGGAITTNLGWLGARYPFITIKRKVQALPKDYTGFYGFPAHIQSTVGNCKGFSQFSSVHVENLNATDSEKLEIEDLLMKGVYI